MRAPLRLDRRAVLLGGVAASIWGWRGAAGAAAPAPARRLTAAPASAGARAPARRADAPARLRWNRSRTAHPARARRRAGAQPRQSPRRADDAELPGSEKSPMRSPASPASPRRRSSQAAKPRFASRRPTPASTSTCPTPARRPRASSPPGLFGPIVVEEPSPPEVDLEAVVVLADWRLDEDGPLARRRRVGRSARHRRRVGRAAAVRRAAGSARSSAPRQRLGDAGDDDRRRRRDAADRRHRRPAERAVHAAAQPLSDRARRAFRTHLRHGGRGGRVCRCATTPQANPTGRWSSSPAPARRSRRALRFRDFPPIRCCRRRSTSPARGASS